MKRPEDAEGQLLFPFAERTDRVTLKNPRVEREREEHHDAGENAERGAHSKSSSARKGTHDAFDR